MTNKLNNAANPTAHANGAQPASNGTENNVVNGQIYAAIHNGQLAINKLVAIKADAGRAVDTGKAATYTKLAQLAYDSNWSNAAIKEQITILRAKDNTKGKNYFGEVSKVMQENVRFHVPAFFRLAKDAFATDSETMVKAHRREIFYVLNYLIPEAVAGITDPTRVVPANADEAVAAAKARLADPSGQVKADFETVKRMAKALVEMGKRYESASLGTAATTLATVTLGALDIAHKKAAITEHQVNEQAATIATARAQRDKPTNIATRQPAATLLPGGVDIETLMAGMASRMSEMMDTKIAALVSVAPKARARK